MCTKEQLKQVYNLGYEHGKAYAEMKATLTRSDYVVRCCDCKHYLSNIFACRRKNVNGIKSPDDFCSYGERKE